MEQYLKQGLAPDSKVLDIRQVDVSTGRFLEDNTPVYVITFTTQEVLLFRNRKTREVVVGAENRVEQCNYAAVITRVEEELENELTGGWKVIEVRGFFSPLSHVWTGTDDGIDGTSVRACISITNLFSPISDTDVAMGSPAKTAFVLASHPVLLPARMTFNSHHHSRNIYTHILIRAYYCVRHLDSIIRGLGACQHVAPQPGYYHSTRVARFCKILLDFFTTQL